MRADELRSSAEVIAGLLKRSDLLTSIRQCRDARDENSQSAASSRLSQSAKIILQAMKALNPDQQAIAKQVHLDKLASVNYWKALISTAGDPKIRHAELVQVYSRVLFASSHLPALTQLLNQDATAPQAYRTAKGEEVLTIRLTDAGEKAADPDRIARAIDGIDMIYSACASLARKPAMDMLLLEILGHPDKTIAFVGDQGCVAAVCTVIESIPDAVAQFDPDEELELAEVVVSLPVFDDLATLDKLGTFSKADIQNIEDTMHQGVLLALESGVILMESPESPTREPEVQTLNKRAQVPPEQASRSDTATPVIPPTQIHSGKENSAASATGRNSSDQQREALQAARQQIRDQQARKAPTATKKAENSAAQNGRSVSNGVDGGAQNAGLVEDNDEFYQQYLAEREKLREPSGFAAIGASLREVGDRGSAMASLLKGLGRAKD